MFQSRAVTQVLIDSLRDLRDLTKARLMLSPGWARVGLTFGDAAMREAALNELAGSIADRIANPPRDADPTSSRSFKVRRGTPR